MVDAQIQILLIETAYFLMVLFPALYIYDKTRKIYRFSSYESVGYFSFAFLSLAAAFIFRYIAILSNLFIESNFGGTLEDTSSFFIIGMEFFMMLPGFFLFYSIFWKRFEKKLIGKQKISMICIFIAAIALSIIDYINSSFILMYISQIILFGFTAYQSFKNQSRNSKGMGKIFYLAMLIILLTWVINLSAQYLIPYFPAIRIYAYVLTSMAIFIIAIVVHRVAKEF